MTEISPRYLPNKEFPWKPPAATLSFLPDELSLDLPMDVELLPTEVDALSDAAEDTELSAKAGNAAAVSNKVIEAKRCLKRVIVVPGGGLRRERAIEDSSALPAQRCHSMTPRMRRCRMCIRAATTRWHRA